MSVKSTVMNQIEALPSESPPPAPPPSPNTDSGGGTGGSSSSSSTPIGAIVGGVVGGLAVVAGLFALFVARRRRRRGGPSPSPHDSGSGSDSPKALGAMEQGHGSHGLYDFPKPGDMGNGYSVAALAAGELGLAAANPGLGTGCQLAMQGCWGCSSAAATAVPGSSP